jgi:hypothetical protein
MHTINWLQGGVWQNIPRLPILVTTDIWFQRAFSATNQGLIWSGHIIHTNTWAEIPSHSDRKFRPTGVSVKYAAIRVVLKSTHSHTWAEPHRLTDRKLTHQGNRSRLCRWCDSTLHVTYRHRQNSRCTYVLCSSISCEN